MPHTKITTRVFLMMVTMLLLAIIPAKALDFGTWTTSAADAKRLALSTGRPILAVFYSGSNCVVCEALEKQVWETAAFQQFARENKLVLYRNKVASNLSRINAYYKSQTGNADGLPSFFIFKVNSNATFTDETYKAFTGDEVTLPAVTNNTTAQYKGPACPFPRPGTANILGVSVSSSSSSWTVSLIENIITNCFPIPSGKA